MDGIALNLEYNHLFPFKTIEEAEIMAEKYRAFSKDTFRLIKFDGGYGLEQDLP